MYVKLMKYPENLSIMPINCSQLCMIGFEQVQVPQGGVQPQTRRGKTKQPFHIS